jgi:tetratricopeptide (TPR) repeat protein
MKPSRDRGPRDNSKRKASTFKMIKVRFTIGKVLDGTLSLKGIMLVLFLAALFLPAASAAPQVNATYDQALDALYNLDFSTAEQAFNSLTHQDENNPEYWNGVASTIWLKILYGQQKLNMESFSGSSIGTRESQDTVDPVEEKKLRNTVDIAMTKAKSILAKNPNDVRALYSLGVSNATLASFEGTAKRAYWQAAQKTKEARKYHQQVLKLKPDFNDAFLSVGAYEYVVTVIPWGLRYTILLPLGLTDGDKEGGIKKLETVATKGERASTDAKMLLIVIYNREKRYDQALRVINELHEKYPRNFLFEMSKASIYGKMGNWNEAVAVYGQVLEKIRTKQNGYERLREERMYYEIAKGNIYRGKPEDSIAQFTRVVSSSNSTPDEKADSYIWLGKIFDSQRLHPKALEQYRAVLNLNCAPEYKQTAQDLIRKPYKG